MWCVRKIFVEYLSGVLLVRYSLVVRGILAMKNGKGRQCAARGYVYVLS